MNCQQFVEIWPSWCPQLSGTQFFYYNLLSLWAMTIKFLLKWEWCELRSIFRCRHDSTFKVKRIIGFCRMKLWKIAISNYIFGCCWINFEFLNDVLSFPSTLRIFFTVALSFIQLSFYSVSRENNNAALCIQSIHHGKLCSIYLLSGSSEQRRRKKNSSPILSPPTPPQTLSSKLWSVITHESRVLGGKLAAPCMCERKRLRQWSSSNGTI